jgi:hypothetical protein
VRIFKTRWLARFARKARISDASLIEAIERAERGLVDADLGGGVIKQRVAREGQGRSGGYRTVIALRVGDRAFLIYAFAKNDTGNIEPDVLQSLKKYAAELLNMDDRHLSIALGDGEIEELSDGS